MPDPIQPTPPNTPPPPTHASTAPNSAQTAMAAQLEKLFPSGILPQSDVPPVDPPVTGPTGAATGATGSTGATGEATGAIGEPTGSTGAATGPTGAATGATGAPTGPSGPAQTGPAESGPTSEQLDEAGKKMDLKAGTAFKHVRDENASLRTTNQALAAKLKELEGKTPTEADKTDVAALKAKIDRYEKELSVSRVEGTDRFISEITKPLEKASADLKALAAKYEVAPGDLASALAEPDMGKRSDRLSELSTNFNRMDMNRFDRLVSDIDQKLEQRAHEISQAADKWKDMQAQTERTAVQAAADFKQSWTSALDTSFTKLEKEAFFKPTGNPTQDAEIAKVRDTVKATDLAKLSNEELASALYKAGAFPLLMTVVTDLYTENAQQADQLTKLRGATPPAGAGDPPVPVPPNTVQPTDSFRDVIKTKLHGVLPP